MYINMNSKKTTSYNYIINPSTNRKVSIYSKLGQNIISNYMVNVFNLSGSGWGMSSSDTYNEALFESLENKFEQSGRGWGMSSGNTYNETLLESLENKLE